ncbi:MAG: hypothetical protein PHE17_20860 [Thiothrix sp.]|uniref:hypothetical protein n=1 Tax=Thiothrix sp. TaxID=1032 RepID=UPI002638318C|nr:hypothetical protein [Thiothrix sp.]MDD5395482.1 hypothetical protein [Thiothrix sp.]
MQSNKLEKEELEPIDFTGLHRAVRWLAIVKIVNRVAVGMLIFVIGWLVGSMQHMPPITQSDLDALARIEQQKDVQNAH